MIMTVHPVLVLVPIFGLLVLPCAPMHLKNGFKIVVNQTVDKPEDCDLKLCPEIEPCSMAIVNEDQSQIMCYLISCPNNTQNSSCRNVTKINELFAETESDNVDNNSTVELVPLQGSNGTNSSQSSPEDSSSNTSLPSTPDANVSISTTSTVTKPTTLQNSLTTTVSNLLTDSTDKSATADAVPKPAITAAIPTTPAKTSTTTTTPKPTTTSPKPSSPTTTTTTPKPTTTSPKPSSPTTSTTTTTTVAQTIIPKHPSSPSPSGTNSSVNISPLVPTSNSSSKPVQNPPIPTSSNEKPMPTTPKTSMSPSAVASKLPKGIPKRDQAIVDVAGDSLTSHLLNTSSLLAVLLFGLLFFVVTVALFLKQAYESYKRKDYTQVDYLINGMYSDSGV